MQGIRSNWIDRHLFLIASVPTVHARRALLLSPCYSSVAARGGPKPYALFSPVRSLSEGFGSGLDEAGPTVACEQVGADAAAVSKPRSIGAGAPLFYLTLC